MFLTGKLSTKLNGPQLNYDNLVVNKKDNTIPESRGIVCGKLVCRRVKGSWFIKMSQRMQITLKQVKMLLE